MAQEPLSYEDALGQIPISNESYESALDQIPKGAPHAFVQGTEQTPWEKTKDFIGGMTGFDSSPEEQRAKSADIIAISEHTGQSFSEVIAENLDLSNPVDVPLVESIKATSQKIQTVAKSSYDIQTAGSSYSRSASYGDEKGMEEALEVYHKASQERGEVGGAQSAFENVAYGVTDIVSQMTAMFVGAKEEATAGMAVAVGLAATGVGAPAAIPAATAAAGYGMLEGMWTSFHGLQTMKKIDAGEEPGFAYWTSIPSATALMVAEHLKVGAVVKNIPGLGAAYSKAMGKAVNSVEVDNVVKWAFEMSKTGSRELGTEILQTVIEVVDESVSNHIHNELKGTNLKIATIDEAMVEVKETIKAIGPAAFVLGGAGAGSGYVGSTINRKVAERSAAKQQEAVIASLLKNVEAESEAIRTELQDDYGNQVSPEETVAPPGTGVTVVDEGGNVQPSTPITPLEQAKQEFGYDKSPIDDAKFEAAIIDETTNLPAMVEDDMALANQSGDRYGDFVSGLRQILPKKQAKVVEGLMKARARATNRTVEQFAEDHRLAMRIVSGDERGSVQFIQDGETIVRAFQATDLKAVTHELSHVFRRDLSSVEIQSAESTFGIKDGKWTVEQEEAFADSFVQYVANGKAPTKALEKIFTKLKSWIANTYQTIKGENVTVSPQMEEMFNSFLMEQSNAEYQHKIDQSRVATDTLFQVQGFHGTTESIDKFKTDKVGTGEGSITKMGGAYGWGLYFTEKKQIAEWYAKELADLKKGKRYLYNVTLHKGKKPSEYAWLNWFEANPDTLAKVQSQISKEGLKGYHLSKLSETSTGKELYEALKFYFANQEEHDISSAEKAASLFLLKSGVDGIKYPSESMRPGAKSESSNYVVFDEDAVTIESQTLFQKQEEGAKGPFAQPLVNIVKEVEAVKQSLLELAKAAQRAHKEGNKEGYQKAMASYKALIQRTRNRAAMNRSKSKLRKKIRLTAKKFKPYKKTGRPKGKFTPAFQDEANIITYVMSRTKAQAKDLQKILKYNRNVNVDQLTSADLLAEELVKLRTDTRNMDEIALSQLLRDLEEFYKTGKNLRHKKIAKRQQELKQVKGIVLDSLEAIRSRKGLSLDDLGDYEAKVGVLKKQLDSMTNFAVLDFTGFMEMLDMGLTDKLGEGAASLFGEVLEHENTRRLGVLEKTDQVLEGGAKIFGETDEKMMRRFLHEEEREGKKVITQYKELNRKGEETGVSKSLNLNRAEARNLWMELKNDQVRVTWEKVGLLEEQRRDLEAYLTESDKKFVDFQLAFYDSMYDGINAVYREVRDTDLDRQKFYSPVSRDISTTTKDGFIEDLLNDMGQHKTPGDLPTSLITRVNSILVTKAQSDVEKMRHYIRQMEHFKAFAPKILELRSVFNSPELVRSIEATYGKKFMSRLNGTIDDIARNGAVTAGEDSADRLVRQIRGNFAIGAVGAKPLAMAKQLGSTLAYMEAGDMTGKEFTVGLMAFLKDAKNNIAELKNISPLIQTRHMTLNRDIVMALDSSRFKTLISRVVPPTFNELMMSFVKLGDVGAIYAGGWVYYKHLRKQGWSEKDAVFEMEKFTKRTQQYSEMSGLSAAQRGNQYWKLATMFTSSQRMYTQKVMLAMAAAQNKRTTPAKVMRTYLIYMVALPVLFQATSTGFGGDEEDQKAALRAIMAAPFSAVPLGGDVIESWFSRMIEGHTYGRSALEMILGSPIKAFDKGWQKLAYDKDLTYQEILDAARNLLAILELGSIPGRAIGGAIIGASDIATGKPVQGALEVVGMSPRSARRRTD